MTALSSRRFSDAAIFHVSISRFAQCRASDAVVLSHLGFRRTRALLRSASAPVAEHGGDEGGDKARPLADFPAVPDAVLRVELCGAGEGPRVHPRVLAAGLRQRCGAGVVRGVPRGGAGGAADRAIIDGTGWRG